MTGFERFWHAERRGLYEALSVAVGDVSLAAEAIDEAMVRAYQRWSRIGSYDNPAGWCFRVALNWARSAQRKQRRVALVPPPDQAAEGSPVPDQHLWAAVREMSASDREVVALRFVLDWPVEELASWLGVPVGTAKSRTHRALARLRERLEVEA